MRSQELIVDIPSLAKRDVSEATQCIGKDPAEHKDLPGPVLLGCKAKLPGGRGGGRS